MPVILITLDGVRPDATQQANTPHLDKIINNGAYTFTAQSVMPTMTLPCHMSIFHSVPSERHGILTNDFHPMVRPLPGLFEQIKYAGKRSAMFYSWDILRDLSRPLMVSYTFHIEVNHNNLTESDFPLVDAAAPLIAQGDYDFYFVHLDSADEIGHISGWMSDPYLRQVEVLDSLVGRLLDAANSTDTFLVEADHGGHDRNHGTDKTEDMTIPWMLCGSGVREGHQISAPVSLLDTAPTIARLLDVTPAAQWEGNVIDEVFASGSLD